jgi:hypothetical protein
VVFIGIEKPSFFLSVSSKSVGSNGARIRNNCYCIRIDTMRNELIIRILARRKYLLAIRVKKIVVFPPDISPDNTKFFDAENAEITIVRNIGMEGSHARNTENFTEHNRFPTENKLGVKMKNIRMKISDFLKNFWRKTECNFKIRIKKSRESSDRKYFNIW